MIVPSPAGSTGMTVADRRRRVEVAEGDRHAAIRQQAFDVIQTIGPDLDLDEPPERAALDPLRGEAVRIGVGLDNRQGQGHRDELGPRSGYGHSPGWAAEPNTPDVETTTS